LAPEVVGFLTFFKLLIQFLGFSAAVASLNNPAVTFFARFQIVKIIATVFRKAGKHVHTISSIAATKITRNTLAWPLINLVDFGAKAFCLRANFGSSAHLCSSRSVRPRCAGWGRHLLSSFSRNR
jgi:hypothetical protein